MLAAERFAAEWLETDGLGGFASGTIAGWRTRRYHGLLTPAVDPPARRTVLVDGFEAWLELDGERHALSCQRYLPDVTHPTGHQLLTAFSLAPWPKWTWQLPGGVEVSQEILLPHGRSAAVVHWTLKRRKKGARLIVRPFLSGRESHALSHESGDRPTDSTISGERVQWPSPNGLPAVISLSRASYSHQPVWYHTFLLEEERARGFDHSADLFSPGELTWDIAQGEASWLLYAEGMVGAEAFGQGRAQDLIPQLVETERQRRVELGSPLERAADQYIVVRGEGKTIIAGYPWFTDWGRDTFIALRGLCLATGRLDDAKAILLAWCGAVSEGMLPNRFVEQGDAPEFNSVDASLWFVVAVEEFLAATRARRKGVTVTERTRLQEAVDAIVGGYAAGTRYGIGLDGDGLIHAGVPGVQLTWMDAKVGDWVVTPRIGKPVEIQALWINALQATSLWSDRWRSTADRALASFRARFWHHDGYLCDVVDPDGRVGEVDATFRPNQLFAVGGLPRPVLDLTLGRQMVDEVERRLWTPLGPRSLAPDDSRYVPHYMGGPLERDGAYHQGTVWPFLAGPFVEAWVRVRDNTPGARAEARLRFLNPLLDALGKAGQGHLPEIADAEPPHTPRGCPFQAWSMGELLRLDRVVLAEAKRRRVATPSRRKKQVT